MTRSVLCYDGATFDYTGGTVSTFPGAVSSVFGRTGAVVAASNDYSEAQISFSDITTNNASTSKHGYAPKLPNDATKFLDGTGAYAVPPYPADAVSSVFGLTGAISAATIGGVVWTTITKASDTGRNTTTTVTIDPELQFATSSAGVYEIEIVGLYLSAAGGSTPDFKGITGEDNTTRGILYFAGMSTADSWQTGTSLCNTSGSAFGAGTATTLRGFWLKGLYVGNGGTFGLYWSQFTSNGNDTTLKAGSVLRYRKIG